MTDVVRVDPTDEDLFTRWHAALREGQLAGRPPAPFFTAAEVHFLHTSPADLARRGRTALAAVRDGVVVGAAEVGLPRRHDTASASVELGVPPEHRRSGVATAVWDAVLGHVEDRATLETQVDVAPGVDLADSPGGAFALARGFTRRHTEDHFVLDLPVPREHLRPGPDPAGHRLLSWLDECPDEHADAYAELRTAMASDAPHGELDREQRAVSVADVRTGERSLTARGFATLTTMAFTDDDAPAGYSVVYVGTHDPVHVHQDDTLVARAHRGHGLGRAMKLANHRLLDAHFADRCFLHTWTAPSNGPMQRVNHALGYRSVETTHELALVLR